MPYVIDGRTAVALSCKPCKKLIDFDMVEHNGMSLEITNVCVAVIRSLGPAPSL